MDGRKAKVFAAAAIEAWRSAHVGERPINVHELHDHLARVHGYGRSYRSVLRSVRARWARPAIRTYRRIETPPGAQAQRDSGIWPALDIGAGPRRLPALVMVLSHSRRPAVVWSEREDRVSWIACHNRAFEQLRWHPGRPAHRQPEERQLQLRYTLCCSVMMLRSGRSHPAPLPPQSLHEQ